MSHIICVKVGKKYVGDTKSIGLTRIHAFPWDRVYLVPNESILQVRQMFRYFFSLPLDAPILDLLDRLKLTGGVNESKIVRDDDKLKNKKYVEHTSVFTDKLKVDAKNWTVIIPTSLSKINKETDNVKATKQNLLSYVVTKSVKLDWTTHKIFSKLKLHTPYVVINSICAKCEHVLDFYDGTCEPLTSACQRRCQIHMESDTYFGPFENSDEGVYEPPGLKCVEGDKNAS